MRRHVLATLLVVSSAAVFVPATASAGGYGGASSGTSMSGTKSGMGSSSVNNSSVNKTSSGSGYQLDRKGSVGVGALRVYAGGWKTGSNGEQRRSLGIGWARKDGSVKGFVKSEFKAETTHKGVTTSTAGTTTVKGRATNNSWVSHTAGSDGSSTTAHGREVYDKKGSHAQFTAQSSDGHVTGSSVTVANGRTNRTTYDHDPSEGTTVRGTSTAHADGSTSASHMVHNAFTGKTDRGFAAVSPDGKVTDTRGSSVTANGHIRTWESHEDRHVGLKTTTGSARFAHGGPSSTFERTEDLHNGDQWRSHSATVGNKTFERSSSDTHNLNGDRVYKKTESTTTVNPGSGRAAPPQAGSRGPSAEPRTEGAATTSAPSAPPKAAPKGAPIHATSERVEAPPRQAALPAARELKALPPGASSLNKHVEGKEGGVSVKEIAAKVASGSTNKHVEGREGSVPSKEIIARVAPGGLTGKHSAPEPSPKHAATETGTSSSQ